MTAFNLMLRASPIVASLLLSMNAYAAVPTFSCDGFPYQLLSSRLYKLDPVTLTYTAQGTTNSPSLNGAGFNVLDDHAYAMSRTDLYRLGSDSTRELVSTGIGGALHYVGTMDLNGNFYGLKRTNRKVLIKMDIAASEASGTTVFSEETFTGITPPSTGDFVYVKNGSDAFILLVKGSTLYWYDFQTMTTYSQASTVPPGTPNFNFGATWADDAGRIWGFNNSTGDIYELIDPFGASPSWTLVADLDPSGNNDGFSCNAADFPALPPVAQDDEFTTKIQTALSGNLIADNGNGPDEDPDGAALSVLWADPGTTSPSNGTISAAMSGGSFTYTPNAGFYGVDTFNYVLSDGGATDTALVTITVPADNSDLPAAYTDALHNVIDDVYLGASVTQDTSPNSNTSPDAMGDSDDGLTSTLDFIYGATKTVTVDVAEAAAGSHYLQAWIDWNVDDDFDDTDEQVALDLTDADGDGEISFNINVPTTISSSDSFLRLRWSSQLGLNVSDIAPDGEVEDYEIQLLADIDTSAIKTVQIWDPNNLGLYAIPGNDVIYTITSTNEGDVPVNSVFLVDTLPSEVSFYNDDLDDAGPETHPVSFAQTGPGGLTFNYPADVGYSKGAALPTNMTECNDTVTPGYDSGVNYICFAPQGQFVTGNPDPTFSVSFRARID